MPKKPIIVIGMHRSGTSFLTRVLDEQGVFMGDHLDGNHESYRFIECNDALLAQASAAWDNPTLISEDLTDGAINNIQLIKHFGSLKKPLTVVKNYNNRLWGWKDPRNTFTLPYWLKQFPDAKVVHIYRNGSDCAFSLYKRNQKMETSHPNYSQGLADPIYGLQLWEKYVAQAFSYEEQPIKMITVKYEDLMVSDLPTIKALEEFLELPLEAVITKRFERSREKSEEEAKVYAQIESAAKASHWMQKLGYV